MAADSTERSSSFLGSVTRLIDNAANDGGLENLTNILALLCIFSIVNRGQAVSVSGQASAIASGAGGSGGPGAALQKLLGDLGKGENPSSDTLMSLLPLLNSPQLKSKLNPANIATVLSLINNLGGLGGEKHEPEKPEKKSPDVKDEQAAAMADPAVAATKPPEEISKTEAGASEVDQRGLGRYLNWKSNF